jgi:hypothetical protein
VFNDVTSSADNYSPFLQGSEKDYAEGEKIFTRSYSQSLRSTVKQSQTSNTSKWKSE